MWATSDQTAILTHPCPLRNPPCPCLSACCLGAATPLQRNMRARSHGSQPDVGRAMKPMGTQTGKRATKEKAGGLGPCWQDSNQQVQKGQRWRYSPRCTLSQNGYGDCHSCQQ